jgi:hypothetical protein
MDIWQSIAKSLSKCIEVYNEEVLDFNLDDFDEEELLERGCHHEEKPHSKLETENQRGVSGNKNLRHQQSCLQVLFQGYDQLATEIEKCVHQQKLALAAARPSSLGNIILTHDFQRIDSSIETMSMSRTEAAFDLLPSSSFASESSSGDTASDSDFESSSCSECSTPFSEENRGMTPLEDFLPFGGSEAVDLVLHPQLTEDSDYPKSYRWFRESKVNINLDTFGDEEGLVNME